MADDRPLAASEIEPALVDRAQRGDRQAFSELVRLHQAPVRAYVAAHVRGVEAADDLAQEAFLRAYVRLDSFAMPPTATMRPWLLGIARNLVLEHLRKETRVGVRDRAELEAALDAWHLEAIEAETHDGEEAVAALQRCLQKLAPAAFALVTRHYFERRSLASLAAEQNKKEGALRMQFLRIRETLRACIERQAVTEGAVR